MQYFSQNANIANFICSRVLIFAVPRSNTVVQKLSKILFEHCDGILKLKHNESRRNDDLSHICLVQHGELPMWCLLRELSTSFRGGSF